MTLTSINNGSYGGPKGMVVYCTGNLINSGNINMNERAAYAEGQNVYLYKNSNGTYEFVPKLGANGGNKVNSTKAGRYLGVKGGDAIARGTGGGSGGSVNSRVNGIIGSSANRSSWK